MNMAIVHTVCIGYVTPTIMWAVFGNILIIPCSPFSLCLPIRVTLHNLQRSVLQLFLSLLVQVIQMCFVLWYLFLPLATGQNWSTLCCLFQTLGKCWPKPSTNDRILKDDDPNVLYSLHYWKQITFTDWLWWSDLRFHLKFKIALELENKKRNKLTSFALFWYFGGFVMYDNLTTYFKSSKVEVGKVLN